MTKEWKRGECDFCGHEGLVIEVENGYPRRKANHCNVCYSTHIGNAHFYPGQYDESTMMIIAQVTNMILDEIKKRTTQLKPKPFPLEK